MTRCLRDSSDVFPASCCHSLFDWAQVDTTESYTTTFRKFGARPPAARRVTRKAGESQSPLFLTSDSRPSSDSRASSTEAEPHAQNAQVMLREREREFSHRRTSWRTSFLRSMDPCVEEAREKYSRASNHALEGRRRFKNALEYTRERSRGDSRHAGRCRSLK